MRLIILTLTIFFHCTKDKDSENCINESKVSDMVCIELIQMIAMQMLMELLIILKENVR